MKAEGIVIDHFSEEPIVIPEDYHPVWKYDFNFRKKGDDIDKYLIGVTDPKAGKEKGVWRYLNSSDDIHAFDYQINENSGNPNAEWRIVLSETQEIVKTNVT